MCDSFAADGKTPTYSVFGLGVMVKAVDFNRLLAALQQAQPAYDRALVADMLDDIAERFGKGFSDKSYREQARLLRAADNADAAGVHTARREPDDLTVAYMLGRHDGRKEPIPEPQGLDAAVEAGVRAAEIASDARLSRHKVVRAIIAAAQPHLRGQGVQHREDALPKSYAGEKPRPYHETHEPPHCPSCECDVDAKEVR